MIVGSNDEGRHQNFLEKLKIVPTGPCVAKNTFRALGPKRLIWEKNLLEVFCSAPHFQSETPFKSVKFHKKKNFPWNDLGMPKCPGGPQGHPYQVIWSYLKKCGFAAQICSLCKSDPGPFIRKVHLLKHVFFLKECRYNWNLFLL